VLTCRFGQERVWAFRRPHPYRPRAHVPSMPTSSRLKTSAVRPGVRTAAKQAGPPIGLTRARAGRRPHRRRATPTLLLPRHLWPQLTGAQRRLLGPGSPGDPGRVRSNRPCVAPYGDLGEFRLTGLLFRHAPESLGRERRPRHENAYVGRTAATLDDVEEEEVDRTDARGVHPLVLKFAEEQQ
jgi:hypothetical protein